MLGRDQATLIYTPTACLVRKKT